MKFEFNWPNGSEKKLCFYILMDRAWLKGQRLTLTFGTYL